MPAAAVVPVPAHNEEVLRDLGLDPEGIEDLRRRGVVAEGLLT
jgi:hypothetical protein